MPGIALLVLACAATAVLSWAAIAWVRHVLLRHAVLDRPNARSSHATPLPRGGGLGLIFVVILVWAAAAAWLDSAPPAFPAVMAGVVILAVISWLDDVRGGMPVVARLTTQVIAVAVALLAFPDAGLVFQGVLPLSLDRLVAAFLWIWFINLFNFMDGIDGITGVETASLGTGLAVVAWLAGLAASQVAWPALLAAAALGFLAWNWAPAKIFLGDVGSIPLGFVLGWLLLSAATQGQWLAAAILPLTYLADATITLVRRLMCGDNIWRAHRSHFYQRAVAAGATHAAVAAKVLVCNLVLIGLAVAATVGFSWPALIGAVGAVALLLAHFARAHRVNQHRGP
jgi:UDP-N-acetylmuramyl pentapeptide phosphotransferase/UDP-N-acetylglucosamine-1-phosphate transferase